ncbi:ash family protein [Pectobacterium atrosepticum]|uniref:ash family protein n=1 Tax=Pectobacterium atrosepticum TaxID=29471 RepID=UPI001BFC9060|nr:ash family protein [Pectobacterium atrosepticum]QWC52407.1 ash family protein [Pectobacterium atrosepticum]
MTAQFIRFPGLPAGAFWRYSLAAVAKSTAGRRNPCLILATPDAACVFFCVVALAHLHVVRHVLRRYCIQTMVAQAGQPSGWPVPS